MATKNRHRGSRYTRSDVHTRKKAMRKLPVTLMISVPYGNDGESAFAAQRLRKYRAFAPSTAPMEIQRTLCTCSSPAQSLCKRPVGVISTHKGEAVEGELHRLRLSEF